MCFDAHLTQPHPYNSAPAYPGWNASQPYGQPYAAAPYPPPPNPQLANPAQASPVPPPPAPAAAQQQPTQVGPGSYHGATQPAAAAGAAAAAAAGAAGGYDYSASQPHPQQQQPPPGPAVSEDPTKQAQGASAPGAGAPTEGGKKKASNFTLLYNDNEVSPVSDPIPSPPTLFFRFPLRCVRMPLFRFAYYIQPTQQEEVRAQLDKYRLIVV